MAVFQTRRSRELSETRLSGLRPGHALRSPPPDRAPSALTVEGSLESVGDVVAMCPPCARQSDGGVTRARARAAEKEYWTILVGAAPLQLIGQALHEVFRDLHGGIGLPLTKYRFFAQRRQIGNADKLPFRLRAHVDQRSILLLRQHGVGIFD